MQIKDPSTERAWERGKGKNGKVKITINQITVDLNVLLYSKIKTMR